MLARQLSGSFRRYTSSSALRIKPVQEISHPDEQVSSSTLKKIEGYERSMVKAYAKPNLVISHGQGSYLFDTDGRQYLDFTAGIAVTALGHSDAQVAEVLYDQAKRLVHTSNLYYNEPAGQLAQKLIEITHANGGSWADQLFLANSGTEANEGALKFARKWGKQYSQDKIEIVSFTHAFHGRSMGALTATYNPKYQAPFLPLVPGFVVSPFNDVQQALERIGEKTCGVMIEPIQGEGGVHPASVEFLTALRRRCNETGALLIFDEIQCGLSRTGKLWGHQHMGSECIPDIMTIAKPLANGVPIGAIMTSEKVGHLIQKGDHGTTFGGNPLASAVALCVLNRIAQPEFINAVQEKGDFLKSLLRQVQAKHPDLIKQVRGQGLLIGVEFTQDPTPLVKMARERGLLVVTAGCNTVRIVPPLNISQEEAFEGACKFAGAVQALAS